MKGKWVDVLLILHTAQRHEVSIISKRIGKKETLLAWVCPLHACSMITQNSQADVGGC